MSETPGYFVESATFWILRDGSYGHSDAEFLKVKNSYESKSNITATSENCLLFFSSILRG